MWRSRITSSVCGCFQKPRPSLQRFGGKCDGLTTLWLFVLSDSFSVLCEDKIKKKMGYLKMSFRSPLFIESTLLWPAVPESRLIGWLPSILFFKGLCTEPSLAKSWPLFLKNHFQNLTFINLPVHNHIILIVLGSFLNAVLSIHQHDHPQPHSVQSDSSSPPLWTYSLLHLTHYISIKLLLCYCCHHSLSYPSHAVQICHQCLNLLKFCWTHLLPFLMES